MNYPLHVMGVTKNARGDLLTRLTRDLFHSYGYESFHLDVGKSGREVDLQARHRLEDREVRAECKAWCSPVGGDEINKFVGVLDAERRTNPDTEIQGYFVALTGYTETAIQQEKDCGGRLILLSASNVVTQLLESKILVSPAMAAGAAISQAASLKLDLVVDDSMSVLGHETGWYWLVPLGDGVGITNACIIHADGRVAREETWRLLYEDAPASIRKIVDAYIPVYGEEPRGPAVQRVEKSYRKKLITEYGSITLEGMPAEESTGSRAFKLEELYVPLSFVELGSQNAVGPARAKQAIANSAELEGDGAEEFEEVLSSDRRSLREILESGRVVSILGPPGSGKTTVMKRLVTAFAQDIEQGIEDTLTANESLLPFVIRCRGLSTVTPPKLFDLCVESITKLVARNDGKYAEEIVSQHLHSGTAMVLVDGLDEISDEGHRRLFVSELRTFLSQYPTVRLVSTSREVGFRAIAPAVLSVSEAYTVADLDDEDIANLCIKWHREVLGSSRAIEEEARELALNIQTTDRVRRLAVNPLLLTTLLLVKRWVGQLPRRRTVLYAKALEVLLMTWNVESHEPLEIEDVSPQLGYAAYSMMMSGISRISGPELIKLFQESRTALPELLSYTQHSTNALLNKVEERSSLLSLTGHEVIDGQLQPMYEFKHLTFQEFLAAQAIANDWLPWDEQGKSVWELLEPHVPERTWSEVVSLAAVLSGKKATTVVQSLIEQVTESAPHLDEDVSNTQWLALLHCLVDEVSIAPDLVRKALSVLISTAGHGERRVTADLSNGRFAEDVWTVCYQRVSGADPDTPKFGSAMASLAYEEFLRTSLGKRKAYLRDLTKRDSRLEQIRAAALVMDIGFRYATGGVTLKSLDLDHSEFESAVAVSGRRLLSTARGSDRGLEFMWMWSIAWGGFFLRDPEFTERLKSDLFVRWMSTPGDPMDGGMASWAFSSLPPAQKFHLKVRDESIEFIRGELEAEGARSEMRRLAAISAGVVLDLGVAKEELVGKAFYMLRRRPRRPDWDNLLRSFGESGESALNALSAGASDWPIADKSPRRRRSSTTKRTARRAP